MKIRQHKNGSIKLTAQSAEDSLNLLKFLAGSDPEPWAKEMIDKKEKELEELRSKSSNQQPATNN